LLNVSKKTLDEYGAVSEQTAKEMVLGLKNKSNTDISVAITGIAGPTGGTKDKPVGLIYIGLTNKDKVIIKKFNFSGERLDNKERTCNAALEMILGNI
jgi:PncC family amidohydrolase